MSEAIIHTPIEAKAPYDAVLVHGYWLSRDEDRDTFEGFRGSLRSRLSTRAAADIFHNEGKPTLVFPGGRLKGPDYPATSAIAKAEAMQKYDVPEASIVTAVTGLGTESESITFETLAREHGWTNVGVLSFEQHAPSVHRFTPQIEGTVEHRTVEDVLENYDDPLVSHLAKRLKKSRYGKGFIAYELFKTLIMTIPGGKDRLYAANSKARSEKNDSIFNDLVTRTIDVFK